MPDKSNKEVIEFQPFEGMWLTSPSGAVACSKVINGRLLIPYSHGNDGKLTGHYFDCRVVAETLFCRFERFDSNEQGVLFLKIAPNFTLKGGWWLNQHVSQAVLQDITKLSAEMPQMKQSVWILMPKETTRPWAEKYFNADPPWTAL